ncbi:MAG: 1-deoxy-D-xylulose-5-phosphate synthase [bacterium]|nr:MAG: 1-deoxy-D-xylulose-5-phosphate synthase [bacterium]
MSTLLDSIDSPSDIKKLTLRQLEVLSAEIRKYIIEIISSRGGHLASSLGSVEIALALHYVFDSPRDKILWDVGHQSYAHKIITGRREQFRNIRTKDGISGFPSIFESEHDVFGVGHASTAISAALGLAVARDIRKDKNFIIAVVGDGALSGGIAFEGINQVGHLKKKRFIIVLKDNEMSISKNVGALARYLTKITTKRLYLQLEADVWELLGKIPTLGGRARSLARRIKESIKNLVVPTILFEELGLRYLGPLDGHSIDQLVETFGQLRQMPGPVLVHVVTKKGKGYSFAERDAEKFHGIGSFYKTTGNSRSNSKHLTYSDVFGERLIELARKDEKIVAITAAMKEGTGLAVFAEEFPDRFFDVGIAEQHAVTFAAGLARAGLKPFVAIYSTFLQRSYDQIIHDVALQRLPVRFILDRAGIVGEDGPTHHGTFDLSYLRIIPGMVVMTPCGGKELQWMLETVRLYDEGPIALRFPRGAVHGGATGDLAPIVIGRGVVLAEGGDATILALGTMVEPAIEAHEILQNEGVNAAVVNARFIKPIDEELIIDRASGGAPIITLEENALIGGFGDAVAELLADRGMKNQLLRIGLPDQFVPHGKRDLLLEEFRLTSQRIAARIRELSTARSS